MYRFMRLEFSSLSERGGRTPEDLNGPGLLSEIAEQTGGRHLAVENLPELPDVAAKIGIELRNEYVRGCSPKNTARHGKYRRVIVRLVKTAGLPPLRAMFGTGYYAPTQ
jgi:Ca-activated chloride channel family protein